MARTIYTPEQIAAYTAHLKQLGTYKPEDIDKYAQHLSENYSPSSPGNSPENPQEANIYGDKQRLQSGFSDLEHLKGLLSKGYSSPTQTKGGEMVVRGPDGGYYKDQTNFFPSDYSGNDPIQKAGNMWASMHPRRWLEAHAGKSLPTGGMVAGGGLGSVLAAASDGLAIPVAGTGAALGAGAGEAMRQYIGQKAGLMNQGDQNEVNKEMINGGVAEVGGGLLNKVPGVPQAMDYLTAPIRAIPSMATKLMTAGQVPFSAAMRASSSRGLKVRAANALGIGSEMGLETKAALKKTGDAVGNANADLLATKGGHLADTQPLMDTVQKYAEESAPNSVGTGKVSAEERQKALDDMIKNLTRGDQTKVPLDDLKKYMDSITNEKTSYAGNELKNPISDATSNVYKKQGGMISGILGEQSPELAAANAAHSTARDQAEVLGPLAQPGSMEGFTANIFNKNKTAQQEAAQALAPKSFESAKDLAAKNAYLNAPKAMGFPIYDMARMGLGTGAGASAYHAGVNPIEALGLGLGTYAATQPRLHYELATGLSQQPLPSLLYSKMPSAWSLLKDKESKGENQ